MDISMFQQTVKYSGEYIFIQPFCDFFGIDYINQRKLINRTPLLKKAALKKTSIVLFGDRFERVAVTKRGFITWVLQINDQIVHPNLKEKLLQYQEMIFDFMFGSMERETQIRANYARLKKLKAVYGRIGNEIQRIDKDIKQYLDGRFIQTTLFTSPSSIDTGGASLG